MKLASTLIVSALVITVLSVSLGPLPPIGNLLEPLGGVWTIAEDASPVRRQTLSFAGLQQPVEVYRDNFYVPHIFAKNDMDLHMAVGYLHAYDRLFQMDMQRRAGRGDLSEVLGASMLETDKFLRSIGLKYAAELTLEAYDTETLEVLEAYAAGVNTRIREVAPNALPLEFKLLSYKPRPWVSLDSIVVNKFMGWDLSGEFTDLELKLFQEAFGPEATEELFPIQIPFPLPIIPEESSPAAPSPRDLTPSADLSQDTVRELLALKSSLDPLLGQFRSLGSNNWVVSGSRTDTGAPILANDPHLDLTLPSIWYQMRLSSPSYNVYGVSLTGAPVVVIGFNEHIAWGFTNVGADVVDFFEEKTRPGNENEYLYRGQWVDFDTRQETIHVKGRASVTFEMKISKHHGPVITSRGQTVAMQWTGHRPTFEVKALLSLNKASNWGEFRAALADFHVPAQNVVYADDAGNIGIVVNGLYPIRKNGLGRLPVDGSNGTYDWVGFIPFDEVPSAFNPDQGFLVSANQKPTLENEPYLGWSWLNRYRAARINEVLGESNSISVEDVKALQLDHVSVAAREFVPLLLQAFRSLTDSGASLHPKAPEAIQRLEGWDYDMDAEEVPPTLYWMWIWNFMKATFRDEWDDKGLSQVRFPSMSVLEALAKFDRTSAWFDDVETQSKVEVLEDIVRNSFMETLDNLVQLMGTEMDDWLWGSLHVIQVRHLTELDALSSDVMPRDGGSFTVDVASSSLSYGRVLVTSGPSWRMIVDFSPTLTGGLPTGLGAYPGGQSGHPLSPHYEDLLVLWMRGEYHDLRLSREADLSAAPPSRR